MLLCNEGTYRYRVENNVKGVQGCEASEDFNMSAPQIEGL